MINTNTCNITALSRGELEQISGGCSCTWYLNLLYTMDKAWEAFAEGASESAREMPGLK